MSMLLLIGPENDQGKVIVFVNWLKQKLNLDTQDNKKVNAEKVETKEIGTA